MMTIREPAEAIRRAQVALQTMREQPTPSQPAAARRSTRVTQRLLPLVRPGAGFVPGPRERNSPAATQASGGSDWAGSGSGQASLPWVSTGFVATLQPDANFGRILAAYGGVFVAGSLLWGMALDGFRPDRYDVIGALICLVGVAVIMYAPGRAA